MKPLDQFGVPVHACQRLADSPSTFVHCYPPQDWFIASLGGRHERRKKTLWEKSSVPCSSQPTGMDQLQALGQQARASIPSARTKPCLSQVQSSLFLKAMEPKGLPPLCKGGLNKNTHNNSAGSWKSSRERELLPLRWPSEPACQTAALCESC